MDKLFQQQSWSLQEKVMVSLGQVEGWKYGHGLAFYQQIWSQNVRRCMWMHVCVREPGCLE